MSTFDSPNLQSGTIDAFSSGSGFPSVGVGTLAFGTTYYWRVAILSGTNQSNWSATSQFTTIGQPVLYSPVNGETINGIVAFLQWYDYQGETGYICQIDTVNTFDSPNLRTETMGPFNSFGFPTIGQGNLAFGTTYYWRVAILSTVGQSNWSAVSNFSTITKPNLYSPENGAVYVGSSTTLTWYNIAGETGFAYQLDTSPDFNSANLISGTTDAYTSTIGMPALGFNNLLTNATYYWRIAFLNGSVQSEWSPTWIFGTGATLAVNNPDGNQLFSLYPNPTKDLVFIIDGENKEYTVYSVDGKFLLAGTTSVEGYIDFSDLPKGMYVLRVKDNNGAFIHKVIKQ